MPALVVIVVMVSLHPNLRPLCEVEQWITLDIIVKLRERERLRVDKGKKRKKMDGGWWISFP